MQSAVIIMTTDPALAAEVGGALRVNGHALLSVPARDSRELSLRLTREPTPVALVDLDPRPRQALADLAEITERFPGTRFVALASSVNDELLVEAMEAGVRRVVAKHGIAQDLQGVLNRLTPSAAAADGGATHGDVITILSAGGGCGATTIAANLANEVGAQQAGKPALLLDLDLTYGSLALYFGVQPRYAIDHVLGYDQRIDGELIRSASSVVNDRVHLMASTASMSFSRPELVDLVQVKQVVAAARRTYANTIVDAPRVPMDFAAVLADQSTHVLLVFQLTVKDVRIARSMLDALQERGVTRVVPLANRVARGAAVSVADASRALRDLPVRTLRNDYAAAIEGFNFGKPLAEAAPKSVLRRDLTELMNWMAANRTATAADVR
jgi:pilus assembly protein CpaE